MGRSLQYVVQLTEDQETYLTQLVRSGVNKARVIRRAQTLLMAHRATSDGVIQEALSISIQTVKATRKAFAQSGLEAALYDAPRPGRPQKFDGHDRAAITSIACTEAPEGYAKWSLRLVARTAVELQLVDGIAPSTVYYILKKMHSNRTGNGNGASPN
jgi:putative transposase